MTESHELETIEIHLLLEGMFRYYGFDFRNYALASLKRRIWNVIRSERLTTVSGLQEKVLHNPAYLDRFLLGLSVNVTTMFRDPVCHARPSIDVLFESAADAFGEKAIGIILTGASADGTKGIAKIKSKGGLTLVQEPDSAECRIMPAAAIAAVAVDWILPLSKVAPCLVNLVNS
jgi:two-component system, chemotaxis family, protein-glutamate methylesterase/glutaminase